MSTTSKTIVWIVVVVVVVGGGIWLWSMSQAPAAYPVAQTTGTAPTTGAAPSGNTAPQPPSNSDQAINQSLNSIDVQMNGLASDSASVNQGLNDQPVTQSQL